ncbi:hypothetical protein NE236_04270 [Actinoallomurus purpureus]|uniref:hypothetical protein n=1 Tax=Actinoallomurus purpureus TaxID=478114 RepID=UPI002092ABEA|nr:hypothetical protein [Actinoallomurus purpureus]MCO6004186.1 hypothetical protein [Actinoallomurus purpureus]
MAVNPTFGVDIDAIYDLGNMWIGLGDALHEHMIAMSGAVAGMDWGGLAASSMRWLWGSGAYPGGNGSPDGGITKLLADARDNAYQIGGAINYYADQMVDALEKYYKEQDIALIVALVLIPVSFILPLGFLGRALAAVNEIVENLVGVLTQLSRLGTIGETVNGFISASITGAIVETALTFSTEEIVHAAFKEHWAPDPVTAGITVGGGALYGGLFHAPDVPGGPPPKGIGNGPKATPHVEVPENAPHVNPGGGKNGPGAVLPPNPPRLGLNNEPTTIPALNDSFVRTGNDRAAPPNGTQRSGNEVLTGNGSHPGGPSDPVPVKSPNDPAFGSGGLAGPPKPGQTPAGDFAARPGGNDGGGANGRSPAAPGPGEHPGRSAGNGPGMSGSGPKDTRAEAGGGSSPVLSPEGDGVRVPPTSHGEGPVVGGNNHPGTVGNGRPAGAPGSERPAQGNGPKENADRPGGSGPGGDGTLIGDHSGPPANIVTTSGKTEPSGPSGFMDPANRHAPGGNGGPGSEKPAAAGDPGLADPGRNSANPGGSAGSRGGEQGGGTNRPDRSPGTPKPAEQAPRADSATSAKGAGDGARQNGAGGSALSGVGERGGSGSEPTGNKQAAGAKKVVRPEFRNNEGERHAKAAEGRRDEPSKGSAEPTGSETNGATSAKAAGDGARQNSPSKFRFPGEGERLGSGPEGSGENNAGNRAVAAQEGGRVASRGMGKDLARAAESRRANELSKGSAEPGGSETNGATSAKAADDGARQNGPSQSRFPGEDERLGKGSAHSDENKAVGARTVDRPEFRNDEGEAHARAAEGRRANELSKGSAEPGEAGASKSEVHSGPAGSTDPAPTAHTTQLFAENKANGEWHLVEVSHGQRPDGSTGAKPPSKTRSSADPAPETSEDKTATGGTDANRYYEVDPYTGEKTEKHLDANDWVVNAKSLGSVHTRFGYKNGDRFPVGDPGERLAKFDTAKGRWDVVTVTAKPTGSGGRYGAFAPPNRTLKTPESEVAKQVLARDSEGNIDLVTVEQRPAGGVKSDDNDYESYYSLGKDGTDGWHDAYPLGSAKAERIITAPKAYRLGDGEKATPDSEPPTVLARSDYTGKFEKVPSVSSGTKADPSAAGTGIYFRGGPGGPEPVRANGEKIDVVKVSADGQKVERTSFSPSGEGTATPFVNKDGTLTPASQQKISPSALRFDEKSGQIIHVEQESPAAPGSGGSGAGPGSSGGGKGTSNQSKSSGSRTNTETVIRTFTEDRRTTGGATSSRPADEGTGTPEASDKKGFPGEGANLGKEPRDPFGHKTGTRRPTPTGGGDGPQRAAGPVSSPKNDPARNGAGVGSPTSGSRTGGTRTRNGDGSETVTEKPGGFGTGPSGSPGAGAGARSSDKAPPSAHGTGKASEGSSAVGPRNSDDVGRSSQDATKRSSEPGASPPDMHGGKPGAGAGRPGSSRSGGGSSVPGERADRALEKAYANEAREVANRKARDARLKAREESGAASGPDAKDAGKFGAPDPVHTPVQGAAVWRSADGRLVVEGHSSVSDHDIVVNGHDPVYGRMSPEHFAKWLKGNFGDSNGVVVLAKNSHSFAQALAEKLQKPVTAPFHEFFRAKSGDYHAGVQRSGPDGKEQAAAEKWDGWDTYTPGGGITRVGGVLPKLEPHVNTHSSSDAGAGSPTSGSRMGDGEAPAPGGMRSRSNEGSGTVTEQPRPGTGHSESPGAGAGARARSSDDVAPPAHGTGNAPEESPAVGPRTSDDPSSGEATRTSGPGASSADMHGGGPDASAGRPASSRSGGGSARQAQQDEHEMNRTRRQAKFDEEQKAKGQPTRKLTPQEHADRALKEIHAKEAREAGRQKERAARVEAQRKAREESEAASGPDAKGTWKFGEPDPAHTPVQGAVVWRSADGRLVVEGQVLPVDNYIFVKGHDPVHGGMSPEHFAKWLKENFGESNGVVLLAKDARSFAPALAERLQKSVTAPFHEFTQVESGAYHAGVRRPGPDGKPQVVAGEFDGWDTYAPGGGRTSVGGVLPKLEPDVNSHSRSGAGAGSPTPGARTGAGEALASGGVRSGVDGGSGTVTEQAGTGPRSSGAVAPSAHGTGNAPEESSAVGPRTSDDSSSGEAARTSGPGASSADMHGGGPDAGAGLPASSRSGGASARQAWQQAHEMNRARRQAEFDEEQKAKGQTPRKLTPQEHADRALKEIHAKEARRAAKQKAREAKERAERAKARAEQAERRAAKTAELQAQAASGANATEAGGSSSATPAQAGPQPLPEIRADRLRDAATVREMLQQRSPDQYGQIGNEVSAIVREVSVLPGAHNVDAQRMAGIWQLVGTEILWKGHHAAIGLAQDHFGVPRQEMPGLLEKFDSSRFDPARADVTLSMWSPMREDQFMEDASTIWAAKKPVDPDAGSSADGTKAGSGSSDDDTKVLSPADKTQVRLIAAEIGRNYLGGRSDAGNELAEILSDPESAAKQKLQLIKRFSPEAHDQIMQEASVIVDHLQAVPGAQRLDDDERSKLVLLVAAEIAWSGHNGALRLARKHFGAHDWTPRFSPEERALFKQSRFDPARADVSLGLWSPEQQDEYMRAAAETAGRHGISDEDPVRLIAAEIARNYRDGRTDFRVGNGFAETVAATNDVQSAIRTVRARAVEYARAIVRNTSVHVPSARDSEDESPLGPVELKVAAEVIRSGEEAGKNLARELAPRLTDPVADASSLEEAWADVQSAAREVLARAVESARATVGDLSGHALSLRDVEGGSPLGRVGLHVAAEVIRSGQGAGEKRARELIVWSGEGAGENRAPKLVLRPKEPTREQGDSRLFAETVTPQGSVPPVRPPRDVDTPPKPTVHLGVEPEPVREDMDLVSLLREGGLSPIAGYLEAGKVPQVWLAKGVQRRLSSRENVDLSLSRAVDALIASPKAEVRDADGGLMSPPDTDETGSAAVSGSPDGQFLIHESGKSSGPFESAAGDGRAWQKSSWSGVDCVEVALISTAARMDR